MANLKYQTLDSFIGGLNDRDADYDIQDNQFTRASRNFQLSKAGKPSKRPGYAVEYTLPSNPKSIYRFYKESDGTKHTLISASTFLYDGTTQKYSGLTADKDFYWQDWYESVTYGVNGADGILKYDGTSVTKLTDTNISGIVPKYITRRYGRLFVANDKELWWSDNETPETFDGASMLLVPLNEGESITGIKKIFNNIAIYKHRGISVLRGGGDPTTFSLEDVNTPQGLIAPKTLVAVEGGHVGLGRNGLWFFNGSNLEDFPNMDLVRGIIRDADPELLNKACAAYHDKKIFLNFPQFGSNNNDMVLVYDMDLGCFLPLWDNIEANMFSSFVGSGDDNKLYFAHASNNNVYKLDDALTTDAGTNITFVLETKNMAYDGPERFKKNKKVRINVESRSGELLFQYKLDNNLYSTAVSIPTSGTNVWGGLGLVWGVSPIRWGEGAGMINYRISNSSKSRYIKYKFTHSGSGDVEFIYLTQFFRAKKAK